MIDNQRVTWTAFAILAMFFYWFALKITKCQITHFATHIFSETIAIFVEAQPQGTENGS